MVDSLRSRVLALLGEHHVMTLATTGEDGPWSAAVFYDFEKTGVLKLTFLSAPGTQHARNLAIHPRVAVTIQHDYTDWPSIRGLQMVGEARPIAPGHEAQARTRYQERFPLIGRGAGLPRKLLEALDKIRWYEFVPSDVWVIDNTRGFGQREHYAPSCQD